MSSMDAMTRRPSRHLRPDQTATWNPLAIGIELWKGGRFVCVLPPGHVWEEGVGVWAWACWGEHPTEAFA